MGGQARYAGERPRLPVDGESFDDFSAPACPARCASAGRSPAVSTQAPTSCKTR